MTKYNDRNKNTREILLAREGCEGEREQTWNGVSTVTDGESTVRDGVPAVTDGVSTVTDGVSAVTDGVSTVT
jgi:X-X-X-Leu-X-X-Gly heptad repeat protein